MKPRLSVIQYTVERSRVRFFHAQFLRETQKAQSVDQAQHGQYGVAVPFVGVGQHSAHDAVSSRPSKERHGVRKGRVRSVRAEHRIDPLKHPLLLSRRYLHAGQLEAAHDADAPPILGAHPTPPEARMTLRGFVVRDLEGVLYPPATDGVVEPADHPASTRGVAVMIGELPGEGDHRPRDVHGYDPDAAGTDLGPRCEGPLRRRGGGGRASRCRPRDDGRGDDGIEPGGSAEQRRRRTGRHRRDGGSVDAGECHGSESISNSNSLIGDFGPLLLWKVSNFRRSYIYRTLG
mmetsp:Transcript_49483/g.149118  ORF Transcript_49483/g.149118 Transcript_49483/m.149118 type:complete len:290 (+) Transcript_49483:580-1449(+)